MNSGGNWIDVIFGALRSMAQRVEVFGGLSKCDVGGEWRRYNGHRKY
jgi:hypothetical protein